LVKRGTKNLTKDEKELHREAAHMAQEVFELAESMKANGIDTLDADEFLEETRHSLKNKDYQRAQRMARLAKKSLIILVDQSTVPNKDPRPSRRPLL
jgi:methionine aminopeptidase